MSNAKKTVQIKAEKTAASLASSHASSGGGLGDFFSDFFPFGEPFGTIDGAGRIYDPPLSWENVVGSFTSGYNVGFGNQDGAVVGSLSGGKAIAVIDLSPNAQMEAEIFSTTAGASIPGPTRFGFVTRYSDPNNYILISMTSSSSGHASACTISKIEGGVETVIGILGSPDLFVVGFRSVADQIQLYSDHTYFGAVTTTFNQTATKHGFYTEYTNVVFSYFQAIFNFTDSGLSNPTDDQQSVVTGASPPAIGGSLTLPGYVGSLTLGSFNGTSYILKEDRRNARLILAKTENGAHVMVDSMTTPSPSKVITSRSSSPDGNTMIVPLQNPSGGFTPQTTDVGLVVIKRSGDSISAGPVYHLTDLTYPFDQTFYNVHVVSLDATHIAVSSGDVFSSTTRFYFFTISGNTLIPTVVGQSLVHADSGGGLGSIRLLGTLKGRLFSEENGFFTFIDHDASGVTGFTEVTWPEYPHNSSAGGIGSRFYSYAWNETTGEIASIYSTITTGESGDPASEQYALLGALWDGSSFSFGDITRLNDPWYLPIGTGDTQGFLGNIDLFCHHLGGVSLNNVPLFSEAQRNGGRGYLAHTTFSQSGKNLSIADTSMPSLYSLSNSTTRGWYSWDEVLVPIAGGYKTELSDFLYGEQYIINMGGRSHGNASGSAKDPKLTATKTKVHIKV
jgi:hypothetical protein